MSCDVPQPNPAAFLLVQPTGSQTSNLTYCAAKGLTFDPVRLCSARNGSIETFDPPPAQPQSLYRHPARASSGRSRFEVLCLFQNLACPTRFSPPSNRP